MKLTFLGTGSAFTLNSENYHSNMVLEEGSGRGKLLIDCGSDVRFSLNELGFSYRDIQDVYISHLHADHAGGLEWLAFNTKFDPQCKKPNLYISKKLVSDLWRKVLSGGLSSLPGEVANLATYFNVHPIKENSFFVWHGLEIRMVQTIHIMSGFTVVPSHGLMFETNGVTVFITTDTQFSPHQLAEFYKKADIIFQDCETAEKRSSVHATYQELVTLDESIRRKMWLYHYNPGPLPDAKADGFKGFVKKGQCFDFTEQT